jgi:hypothetical protein
MDTHGIIKLDTSDIDTYSILDGDTHINKEPIDVNLYDLQCEGKTLTVKSDSKFVECLPDAIRNFNGCSIYNINSIKDALCKTINPNFIRQKSTTIGEPYLDDRGIINISLYVTVIDINLKTVEIRIWFSITINIDGSAIIKMSPPVLWFHIPHILRNTPYNANKPQLLETQLHKLYLLFDIPKNLQIAFTNVAKLCEKSTFEDLNAVMTYVWITLCPGTEMPKNTIIMQGNKRIIHLQRLCHSFVLDIVDSIIPFIYNVSTQQFKFVIVNYDSNE